MNKIKHLILLGVVFLSSCAERILPPDKANIIEIAPSGNIIGGYSVEMTNIDRPYPLQEEFNWLDGLFRPKFCRLGPNFKEGSFYHVPGYAWVAYQNDDGSICMVFEEAEELE